ncbi:hypothetical protein NEHOM01_0360 [Nematocida homosporus]|uniref:uncharacterized protein n=1 Tax=Nematocida homosporus TaxID=1912981 RepID=UPI0022204D8B|nr:uncharacterized protein NEHOM01_0360 [Nematocida homosporus]KAI5184758.1 hypothetical protein NEHOM01_0360 [Nematocida homosporus]
MDQRTYEGMSAPEKIPMMDKNLRFYLRKEIKSYTPVNPDEIIDKIEEMSREDIPNPRMALMSTFEEIFQDKTLLFVNRLMGYQRRPCRDGANCRRLGCYFKHPPIDENMMEIDERPMHPRREERYSMAGGEDRHGGAKSLLDKQRRIVEILSKRLDLPDDVLGLIEQLKKLTGRIKPGMLGQVMADLNNTSTRFVISNRKGWMTREHLMTYPGVVCVGDDGVIECATRPDAEQVFDMISKIDYSAKPTWI